jgi:photosystem II stability/assembly factor-like uncharacterized protein
VPSRPPGSIWALAFEEGTGPRIWLSTAQGLFRSEDGGTTWHSPFTAIAATPISEITVHPSLPDTVLAGGNDVPVLTGRWAGSSWQPLTDLPDLDLIGPVAVSPSEPSTLYVGGIDRKQFMFWFQGAIAETRNGSSNSLSIGRSQDGGLTWQVLPVEERIFYRSWLDLEVDSENPRVLYGVTRWSGPFRAASEDPHFTRPTSLQAGRSLDGGETWEELSIQPEDLVPDPGLGGTVFALTVGGIVKSTDLGATWRALDRFPGERAIALVALATSPSTFLAALPTGGILKSTDGGDTWQAASRGLPGVPVLSLAANPAQPGEAYAVIEGFGLYRSHDAGGSWEQVTRDLPEALLAGALAVDPQVPGRVYVGTSRGVFVLEGDRRRIQVRKP